MIHVCHICDTSLEGDYFRNIVSGLTKAGLRVSLIELGSGVAPIWLNDYKTVSYRSLGASTKLDYLLAARRLARMLKDEEIDVLHTHLYFSGLVGVLSKRLQKRAIIALMRHHTAVVRNLGSRIHVAADRWMAEKADRVMTVSHAAKAYMTDVDGIARNDIEVVHLGFDFERMAPKSGARATTRKEFGFSDDDFVIGYVANFVPGKGHAQLLAAFARIHAVIPKAKLIFVGRGELGEVSNTVEMFPSGTVINAGWRSDVSSILNAMDLFTQPSLSEAFSQVIIEAMGCALPVIATDVGGVREVIESGSNGIIVQPDDPDAIADAAIKLYKDPDLRGKMALSGRETVTANFPAERMVARHLELYERWVAEKRK